MVERDSTGCLIEIAGENPVSRFYAWEFEIAEPTFVAVLCLIVALCIRAIQQSVVRGPVICAWIIGACAGEAFGPSAHQAR
jgi:hypothetical protein